MPLYRLKWSKWTKYSTELDAASREAAAILVESLAEETPGSLILSEDIEITRVDEL